MNLLRRLHRSRRGFALLTVLMFIGIMAILTASMLKFSAGERRMNERNRLLLRARNMAENVALYASEQLTTKLYRLRSSSPMAFMTGSNAIFLPSNDVLTTPYSSPSDVEVRAGLTASSGLQYIDPTVSANANNPNIGLSVETSTIPIIAKATMRHPALGSVTAYAEQDLQIAMIPLFQFAVFYNMDMEFGPGPNMIISGPVHANGNLIARIQTGFGNTLQFKERVTLTGGFYADTAHKGKTYMGDGGVDAGPGGTGPLYFQNPAGTTANIKNNSGVWRDYKYGNTTETDTTRNQFKTFATSTYGGNLRAGVHGVTPLNLPSIGGYKEVDDPLTPEDDTKNGRQLIEAPASTDTADLVQAKMSRRSGLYIIVNPDDEQRNGKMPDGSNVTMRARSYRAFLNTVNNDGTHSIAEVILPGQPSWGSLNANVNKMPNAFRTDTSVGSNQVLRTPNGDTADTGYADPTVPTVFPTYADSYFYDLRRGDGSNSYPFNRPSANWVPRPIAKIDFDMTRFKMSVDRTLSNATTSTVYYPSAPSDATWSRSILNADADPALHGLGLGPNFDTFSSGSITVVAQERSGNSAPGTYSARFAIAESTDGGVNYGADSYSSTDQASRTYTAGSTATNIRVRMYLAGTAAPTAANLVDEQFIPIIRPDGSNTATMVLTNEYVVVGSSVTGTPGSTHIGHNGDVYTDVHIYVGGIDDTANWTITPTTTTGSGSFGTGAEANRYTLNSITDTGTNGTATVTFSATRTGFTAPGSKTFTVRKQSHTSLSYGTPAGRTRSMFVGNGGEPFKIYFAPADPNDARITTNPAVFAVGASDLVNVNGACPWFDGITIYVHSAEAETRTRSAGVLNRVDSGVRLWNGRGSLISLSGAIYPGRTGLSFATNDAVYVVGHYNADGVINSSANSTTNPGGYSGRYAESTTEMLTSVMGDAITLLSQPLFERTGNSSNYVYRQLSGWADSLSATRRDDTGWASNWQTTNPSGSNSVDGVDTSIVPSAMPNLTRYTTTDRVHAGSGSARTIKFAPSVTEISTCLLTGIVHTSSAQTSGGVHNFPRLQEQWDGTGLYIRGSMVAMFESQVATEPWTIRSYTGAGRFWGLHQNLRAENGKHDLPLEPIVLNGQRLRYMELAPKDYAAKKTVIEALPH
jgi:type II secretory pathway pseudopilin PulG